MYKEKCNYYLLDLMNSSKEEKKIEELKEAAEVIEFLLGRVDKKTFEEALYHYNPLIKIKKLESALSIKEDETKLKRHERPFLIDIYRGNKPLYKYYLENYKPDLTKFYTAEIRDPKNPKEGTLVVEKNLLDFLIEENLNGYDKFFEDVGPLTLEDIKAIGLSDYRLDLLKKERIYIPGNYKTRPYVYLKAVETMYYDIGGNYHASIGRALMQIAIKDENLAEYIKLKATYNSHEDAYVLSKFRGDTLKSLPPLFESNSTDVISFKSQYSALLKERQTAMDAWCSADLAASISASDVVKSISEMVKLYTEQPQLIKERVMLALSMQGDTRPSRPHKV